ncbi:MAG: enoyl-CoA hydratase-related protein [Spirochaetales bacterium]|uniref:Enoyl-CoA hydratase-related protein n=1 Tax=Candidatus Thalassospirochaeta sargassi TaxID=3119039 RepID=A0AAJ1ID77_9SPIO|nr:enoyl-CoA hydratase-related protein [Spirochaetales bacterium]
MSFKYLKYERIENAVLLTFTNTASLNALSSEVIAEISEAITEVEKKASNDPSLRCLILTGEGKAFIAGADIKEMDKLKPIEACEFSQAGGTVMRKIEELSIPVIAAVNGFALGGGLEVALSCDFAYASDKAKLGFPEATLGIIPGFCGNKRLVDRIGKAAAKELIYTGRMIGAEDALKLGIVNKVCPADELMDTVLSLAKEMDKASPNSVKEAKAMLNLCSDNDLETMMAFETNKFGLIFSHQDAKEGKEAFVGKRKPVWAGY